MSHIVARLLGRGGPGDDNPWGMLGVLAVVLFGPLTVLFGWLSLSQVLRRAGQKLSR